MAGLDIGKKLMSTFPPAQAPVASVAKPAAREELIIRERTARTTLVDHALKAIRFIAETAIFVGVGAIAIAWEGIAKLVKAAYYKKSNDRSRPVAPPKAWPSPPRIRIPMLPIDNYGQLNDAQILQLLDTLSAEQLRVLLDFERSNNNREPVVEAIGHLLTRSGSCE